MLSAAERGGGSGYESLHQAAARAKRAVANVPRMRESGQALWSSRGEGRPPVSSFLPLNALDTTYRFGWQGPEPTEASRVHDVRSA